MSRSITIDKKDTKKIFYKITLYIAVIVMVYALYGLNLITIAVIGFLTVRILFLALDLKSCKQATTHKISVVDDNFRIDDKTFPLQDAYLFFRLKDCGENSAVSLFMEKSQDVETIFQDMIFNPSEFKTFLSLIVPYSKFNTFLWETDTSGTLFVCKRGFMVEGRSLFYNEVKRINWKTEVFHHMTAKTEIVRLYVGLKNGTVVKAYIIHTNEALYAKLIYVSMRVNSEKIEKVTGNKKFAKAFDTILKEIQTKECASI